MIATTPGAGNLASFVQLYIALGLFAAVVLALLVKGRPPVDTSDEDRAGLKGLLLRIPGGLERLTRIPGWAFAAIGTTLFGLLVAGLGFYADVAWHVALGRDKELFTAPHTEIVVGLVLIETGALLGILFANLQGRRQGLRLPASSIWVPWSLLPLASLGFAAVMGFPLDDLWHARYGIDVTMWSPTHMLMICGAALSGLASWLILADAGVTPDPKVSKWGHGAHILAAVMTLLGLAAVQGEFNFGVPQFQPLYLPVLIALAAGMAVVAMRIVLGPWRALIIVGAEAIVQAAGFMHTQDVPARNRISALYVASAIVVELLALAVGTEKRLRFALLSGVGIATFGLAGEALWNANGPQPWHQGLLVPALLVGGLMALSASVLGAGLAGAVLGKISVPRNALILAGVGTVAALVIPFPRHVGNVSAALTITPAGPDQVLVRATVTPADAADDNLWFQVTSWQGGHLYLADMHRDPAAGPGAWKAVEPTFVGGNAKAVLRLARGSQMMAIPVRFPADEEIGAPAIEPVDRTQAFEKETHYLLREQHGGSQAFAYGVYALLAGISLVWVGSFLVAAGRVSHQDTPRGPRTPRPRRPRVIAPA